MAGTLQFPGTSLIFMEWSSLNSASLTTNQFLASASSTGSAVAAESQSQGCAACNFGLLRLAGCYSAAGTQTSTMTPRVNGVSQNSLQITVGTGTTVVTAEVTTAIRVLNTDRLSVLWKFTVGDANNQSPRATMIGIAQSSL